MVRASDRTSKLKERLKKKETDSTSYRFYFTNKKEISKIHAARRFIITFNKQGHLYDLYFYLELINLNAILRIYVQCT